MSITIKQNEDGVVCFFMGCGGVVEHHCLVDGTMLKELTVGDVESELCTSGRGIDSGKRVRIEAKETKRRVSGWLIAAAISFALALLVGLKIVVAG